MATYLHGVEIVEAQDGPRAVLPAPGTFIGIVGTALDGPSGDPETTLGPREAADTWGSEGTIPAAIAAVHSQGRAPAIAAVNALDPATHRTAAADEAIAWGEVGDVIRLAHSRVSGVAVKEADDTAVAPADYELDAQAGTLKVLSVDNVSDGDACKVDYKWVDASKITAAEVAAAAPLLCEAEESGGRTPDVLIAPGWSSRATRSAGNVIESAPVTSALAAVADRCRAIVVADGPGASRDEAIAYRGTQASRRVYVVDPALKVLSGDGTAVAPASGYVAGLIARIDAEVGWWASPSNRELRGIAGTSRFVSFGLGDSDSEANLLNASEVATVIRANGWRLWGNRTCSADPKWVFLSVVRIADRINGAILRSHLWAVDRNITTTYVSDVVEGVNAYLRDLRSQGAILGGRCWADPDLNPNSQVAAGKLFLDFDFTAAVPAERITFRSSLVDDYVETIF